jgi:spore maturation protein CgeB
VGKGWDKLGLHANLDHAGDRSGHLYAQSQISLNLFGGCVHGGMPLRPFDIGASGGLILTHDQRELPALFEPGKECLAFRNQDEMLALLDHVLAAPAEFNAIAQAGRRRVQAQHTWSHRISRLQEFLRQHP